VPVDVEDDPTTVVDAGATVTGRTTNVRPPRTWARQLNEEEEDRQQNNEELNEIEHQRHGGS
jgi:hypothetical protein